MKAYEEIVEFIAGGPSVSNVANFQASAQAKERVEFLIRKEKTEGLSPEEKMELEDFMQLEHLMRLVKARAHRHLAHGVVASAPRCGDWWPAGRGTSASIA